MGVTELGGTLGEGIVGTAETVQLVGFIHAGLLYKIIAIPMQTSPSRNERSLKALGIRGITISFTSIPPPIIAISSATPPIIAIAVGVSILPLPKTPQSQ